MASKNRRDEILEAAGQLFADKGVVATTVREIADSVGILSGSLYHHFASKDEILEALITTYLDDILARYEEVAAADVAPGEKLRRLIRASLEVGVAHPHATEIYQNNARLLRSGPSARRIKSAATTIQKTWLDILEAGVASGDLRDDIPAQVVYRMMRDAIWLAVRWFKPTASFAVADLERAATSLFLEGIVARDHDRVAVSS